MAYLALYRKYRPQTFDQLIGQDPITKTLINQIKRDQIGHAYLFTGTRGVGKTSAAKIFARAVNCEHPVNGSPCMECAVCKALADSANTDVVEIDAASNNRVDEIRELRGKVQYPPVVGRYKVFIIDEVHMLTDSAFNALLKTLEEPPRHALFLLCTTEPQKLPATILSRCMRFDFRLVSAEKITALLKDVFRQIGQKASPEALHAIALHAEGSIRDALSLADRCLALEDGELTYESVTEVLGATDRREISQLTQAILTRDVGGILRDIDALSKSGKNISVLARDLAAYFRDLLVVKTCADAKAILALPENLWEDIKRDAELVSDTAVLLKGLDLFTRLEGELRYAASGRILLETAALKAAEPPKSIAAEPVREPLPPREKPRTVAKETKKAPEEARDYALGTEIWSEVLKALRERKERVLFAACGDISNPYVSGQNFVIVCSGAEYDVLNKPEFLKILSDCVAEVKPYNVILKHNVQKKRSEEEEIRDLERVLGENTLKII